MLIKQRMSVQVNNNVKLHPFKISAKKLCIGKLDSSGLHNLNTSLIIELNNLTPGLQF